MIHRVYEAREEYVALRQGTSSRGEEVEESVRDTRKCTRGGSRGMRYVEDRDVMVKLYSCSLKQKLPSGLRFIDRGVIAFTYIRP
jgi:hypothetical protein